MGDFNIPLIAMDRSSRQKINKETQALNEALDQLDLIDIYRTVHPKAAEYTFLSSAKRTFLRIDHILGHKSSCSKFKKTEIISSIFSNHNTIRLEINKKKLQKHKWVETKQHATKTTNRSLKKSNGKSKKYLETNENKITMIQKWDAAKAVLKGKFITT